MQYLILYIYAFLYTFYNEDFFDDHAAHTNYPIYQNAVNNLLYNTMNITHRHLNRMRIFIPFSCVTNLAGCFLPGYRNGSE